MEGKSFNNFSYRFIETVPELEQMARILGGEKIIGVDLEADSMYHYFEKVCLIQLATESHIFVVDPLAVKNLSSFRPVFADLGIRKVFHGSDYDIRSLYKDFGIEVNHLFDTQIACKFLGLRETGLEAVLRTKFQVTLDKKFQKKDWSARPLSLEMIEYAATDVMHLIPLARLLERELKDKGRLSWVEEECAFLSKVRPSPPTSRPLYFRVKGADRLDPRSLAVLEAILQFRNARAKQVDLPPFKVLGNEAIMELALQKPLTLEGLEAYKILSQRQVDRFGMALIEEIKQAMAVPEESLLVHPRKPKDKMEAGARKRIKALKTWRDARAEDLQLEPGVIFNNALIQALAEKNPRYLEDLGEVPGLKKWQRAVFSKDILAILNGHAF